MKKYIVPVIDEVPAQRWISVNERLPEVGRDVLVYVGNGVCKVCWMEDRGDWHTSTRFFGKEDVTHWMPLPEPPKE